MSLRSLVWQLPRRVMRSFSDRRISLWVALVLLLLALLATLVWLAGRYEASQVQAELERGAADAVSDIRSGLSRNNQALLAVPAWSVSEKNWQIQAQSLLSQNREWLRMEWRDAQGLLLAHENSPLRVPAFDNATRQNALVEIQQACMRAQRLNDAAYSRSYFLPQPNGLGMEVMELCLPILRANTLLGFAVVSYSLQGLLASQLGDTYGRRNQVSFTEPDGTRLAIYGEPKRANRLFHAQQLLDLPGNTLVLRIDGRRAIPDLFPNVLTALVTAMSIALVSVLLLLVKDSRRRLKAERDLADALAFRKAMEDSLVTGLRARDLQGRITYVNPAFCQMVGLTPAELLGCSAPMPYWPPEMAGEYQQRQAVRLAGNAPPREGFESVFMRKDGSRFSVLIIEAPLINVQGQQTGWMSAFLDMSEQRKVEELSRASQERLQATARLATVGEMASLLSHELNQPLAAISSYAAGSLNLLNDASQLQREPLLGNLQMALQRIAEQAGRAGKVINSVHDFVRRRDQNRQAIAPSALISDIMPLVLLQARKLQVRVETLFEERLPQVLCDRTMVEQVLLNLARNGMQAMDHPTCARRVLTLQVRRAASNVTHGWIEFSVIDAGIGIAPEVAKQLFTPFFTTKDEGMGLGLSLCRTVVEQHGGRLEFSPYTPRGTVFRFTLPTALNA
ncbi:MAG: PAS domain S-box protein [Burkholderiales bacterium]|jgi:two-component system sensor histidine kinase DctS|nr:PAS domain S-box protein [Burkholderiales bacterium]